MYIYKYISHYKRFLKIHISSLETFIKIKRIENKNSIKPCILEENSPKNVLHFKILSTNTKSQKKKLRMSYFKNPSYPKEFLIHFPWEDFYQN